MGKKVRRNKSKSIAFCIVLMVLFCVVYVCGQLFCKWDKFDETVTTIFTIIGAAAFLIEFKSNEYLNESQFIMELNNQFISNSELTKVESDLDNYFEKYDKNELTDEYRKEFYNCYANDKDKRQNLVNYLVHLEGVAAIINNGVLHFDIIDNLMSYRYFIAVNNPDVQKLELCQYPDFYKGCYQIYENWVKKQTTEAPMIKDYRLPKLEEIKQCKQKRN